VNLLLVSIVIPCYNEEKTIEALLSAILGQTHPVDQMEVVIADGMSTDRTRERIQVFQATHPELDLHVVENIQRTIPAALNQAIAVARGEVITRMDAHAIPAVDYIERSLSALEAGLGDNVGGVIEIRPGADSWIAQAISIATAHPLGVGDAHYRTATRAMQADTVAFGTYYRSLLEKIGKYDETLLVNEDYEFNTRIRKAGGTIWVDPAIRCVYYSRASLRTLARQYFTYGYWKYMMLHRYPETLRWRQALPPVFVSGILMLLLLSIIWKPSGILLALILLSYLVILAGGSLLPAVRKKKPLLVVGIPIAIVTMHFSWGSGFMWSMIKSIFSGKKHGN
jgi:glycosyltransferase involved in cell wall biosynthesis